jgi:D-alanyl-D-alanine carboxypeptidase/D-alanyl-D-alanine-endopeptidase (penicillin-binding protein 4)
VPRIPLTVAAGLAATLAVVGVGVLPGPPAGSGVRPAAAAVLDRTSSGSATTAATTAGTRRATDPALESRLVEKLQRSTAGRFGMVVDIAGVGRVATINPAGGMRPASTQKLFTALPVLLHRPDSRLVTTVTAARDAAGGVLRGNLVVHASADPSLLPRHLSHMARDIRDAGIRRVTGRLVLDIGDLPLRTTRDGWKPDFVPTDIGPLSPFPVYEDVWRKDPGYLSHPTKANLNLFRARLADAGVRVVDGTRIVRDATDGRVVAQHRSASLRVLVRHTLRVSDNFYAESLLSVMGGLRAVDQVVADAGITDLSVATDGSGLSYDARQSPRGEVQLLRYARSSPAYEALRGALPVACESGTLEHRFCDTIGAGMVWAKTGTLEHSTALAGWTRDGAGRLVTFSVITAGVRDLWKAMQATDRAVLVLRRYTG